MTDWLLPLILAPFIGSFLALLIRRLPAGLPVAMARSRCESCDHVLGPWELIPLVSAAWLAMRCRWCRSRISLAHPATELACLAIAAVVVMAEPDTLFIWLNCILGWWLLSLAWIDWEHMLLPDVLTLPLVLAGLGATMLYDPAALPEHAAAAVVGYAGFRAIEIGYRWLRGVDGLGQGDAKLLAAGGAWVGLAPLSTVVFVAAVCGLALSAGLRLAGRTMHRGSAIPFGPPLCVAIWLTWIGFDPILWLADKLSMTRSQSARRHGQGGFSLLEVMIALVIAGLALGAVFRAAAEGSRATSAAAHYQEAISRARSHLDGTAAYLVPGEQEGDDGAGFHWRTVVHAGDFHRQTRHRRTSGRER